MAGHADCGSLTASNLLGIGGLIVFLGIRTDVVGETFLVVIIVSQTSIQTSLERSQIHRIGVKDILIFDFCVIPRLCDMDFVSISFGILSASALAQNISTAPIVDIVIKAVIAVVQLLDTATAPSCMIFRVLQDGFPLAAVGIEVCVSGINAIPMISIKDAVIIGRRVVVA